LHLLYELKVIYFDLSTIAILKKDEQA